MPRLEQTPANSTNQRRYSSQCNASKTGAVVASLVVRKQSGERGRLAGQTSERELKLSVQSAAVSAQIALGKLRISYSAAATGLN